MSTYEKLGIALDVKLSEGFTQAIQQLENSLKRIDMSKLTKDLDAVSKKMQNMGAGAGKSASAGTKNLEADIKKLNQLLGTNYTQALAKASTELRNLTQLNDRLADSASGVTTTYDKLTTGRKRLTDTIKEERRMVREAVESIDKLQRSQGRLSSNQLAEVFRKQGVELSKLTQEAREYANTRLKPMDYGVGSDGLVHARSAIDAEKQLQEQKARTNQMEAAWEQHRTQQARTRASEERMAEKQLQDQKKKAQQEEAMWAQQKQQNERATLDLKNAVIAADQRQLVAQKNLSTTSQQRSEVERAQVVRTKEHYKGVEERLRSIIAAQQRMGDPASINAITRAWQQEEAALRQNGLTLEKYDKRLLAVVNRLLQKHRLKIDTSGAVKQLNTVEQTMSGVTKSTTDLRLSLAHMTKRLVEFYSIRFMLFTASAAIREAMRSTVEFSQVLHEVAAISSASAEQMRGFKEAALEVGRTSKFTAVEVSKAMKLLAQAGVAARDLAQVTKNVEWFATGTGASAADAAKAVTTAMNVWKIEAEDVNRITSTLTATLNNSRTQISDMSVAFNYLANQGAVLGKSIEEVSTMIGVMANQGIRASTIGTGMSNLLAVLSAPTWRFQELLDEFGISLSEISPRMNNFADIIDRFNEAGVSTERILQSLDKRVGRTMVAAINAGGDAFRSFQSSISGTNADFIAYTTTMEGSVAKINVLKSELLVLISNLKDSLQPAINFVYNAVVGLIVGLDSWAGKTTMLAGALTGLSYALWRAVAAFGALKTAIVAANVAAGTFMVTTGFVAGAAIAITGALVALFGHLGRASQRDLESWKEKWVEISRSIQASTYAVSNLTGELNKAQKEYGDQIELTDTMRAKLEELSAQYPALLEFLEEETVSYEKLKTAIDGVNESLNQKRQAQMEDAVLQYNLKLGEGDNRQKMQQYNELKRRRDELETRRDRTASEAGATGSELSKIGNIYNRYSGTRVFPHVETILSHMSESTDTQMKDMAESYIKEIEKRGLTRDLEGQRRYLQGTKLGGIVSTLQAHRQLDPVNSQIDTLAKDPELKALISLQNTALASGGAFGADGVSLDLVGKDKYQDKDLPATSIGAQGVPETLRKHTAELWEGVATTDLKNNIEATRDTLNKLMEEGKELPPDAVAEYTDMKAEYAQRLLEEAMRASLDALLKSRDIDNATKRYLQTANPVTGETPTLDTELEKQREKLADATVPSDRETIQQNIDDLLTTKAEIAKLFEALRAQAGQSVASTLEGLEITGNKAEDAVGPAKTLNELAQERIQLERAVVALRNVRTDAEIQDLERQKKITGSKAKQLDIDREILRLKQHQVQLELDQAQDEYNDLTSLEGPPTPDTYGQVLQLEQRIEQLKMKSQGLQNQESDMGNQNSFNAGFRNEYDGVITSIENSMGTLKKLGEETGRSLEAALTAPFDAMVEATMRGENGLKAFSNTLGKIMQEAGAEIMKYYLKLVMVYVIKKAIGMAVGSMGGGMDGAPALESGGTAASFSGTDFLVTRNEGGDIPSNIGIPGQDSVPALLTPGEFVISQPAVAHYGSDFLHKINRRRFADGGTVGSAARNGKAGAGEEEKGYTINVINVVDPTSIPKTTDKEILNVIQMDAVKNGPVIRTIKGSLSR